MCPGSVTGGRAARLVGVFVSSAVLACCQVDDRALSPPDTAAGTSSGDATSGAEGGPGGSGPGGSGGSSNGNGSGSTDGSTNGNGGTTSTAAITSGTTGAGSSSNEAASVGTSGTATSGGGATGCEALGDIVILESGVPFAQAVYTYSDQVSTICIESPEPGSLCAYGVGADSRVGTEDYANWGAGLGFRLAPEDADGTLIAPFDANALGIVGVRYRIEFFEANLDIRVGVTQVNTTEITFEDVAYGNIADGNGDEGDVSSDAEVTVLLDDLSLPSWSDLDADPETVDADVFPFDPTQMHSLQFQVVTRPGNAAAYDFCLSNFEWFDAANAVVSPP